jgi:mono/diheme cytochrome c family protein
MRRFLFIVVIIVVVLVGVPVWYSYSGKYDISANTPDPQPVAWLLHNTFEHSLARAGAGVTVPAGLETPNAIRAGAQLYGQECVYCHGAPGEEATGLAKGLNPPPPVLLAAERDNIPGEVFWVVRNGVKMSGMPAWGKSYPDQKIWAVAAFLHAKKGLGAAEYKALTAESEPGAAPPPAAPAEPALKSGG